MVNKYYYHSTL